MYFHYVFINKSQVDCRLKKIFELNLTRKFLLIIIFLGAFLRLYNLGVSGTGLFTFNEAAQFLIATHDSDSLINAIIQNDFAPPLYHFLLRIWVSLGKTEFIARLFSAIFGIFSIPIIYLISKELYNEKVGLISAMLLAMSPFNVWASQITRHYSLFLFITLCSVYYFIQILNNPYSSKKTWFLFVTTTLMMMYTHYFSFLVIVVENFLAVFFVYRNKIHLKSWIVSQISLCILYIPWLPFLFMSIGRRSNPYSEPMGLSIIEIPLLFEYFSIGILHTFNSWKFDIVVLILAIIIYSIFFAKGLLELKNNKSSGIIILSFLFIPLIISFLFGSKIGFAPRYLINISFAYYIIISLALSKVKDKRHFFAIIACLLLISVGTIYQNQVYFISIAKNDLPEISDYINTHSVENDVILIAENQAELNIAYYYTGSLEMYGLPEDFDWEKSLDQQLFVYPENMNITVQNIQMYTNGHKRFWYINLKANDMPQLISTIKGGINKNEISNQNDILIGGDIVKEYLDNNYKLLMKNEIISEKYKVYLYANN